MQRKQKIHDIRGNRTHSFMIGIWRNHMTEIIEKSVYNARNNYIV